MTRCLWDILCDLCGAGALQTLCPLPTLGLNPLAMLGKVEPDPWQPIPNPSSCRKSEITQTLRLGKLSKITDSNFGQFGILRFQPLTQGSVQAAPFIQNLLGNILLRGFFYFLFGAFGTLHF